MAGRNEVISTDGTTLQRELQRVTAALLAAEAEERVLARKIHELQARRRELEKQVAQRARITVSSDAPLTAFEARTQAVEAVLRRHGGPMTVGEILDELNRRWGRGEQSYPTVASTLINLHKAGRIGRPRRGTYVAIQ